MVHGILLNNIRAVRGKISGGPGNWARRQAEKREKIVGGGEKVEKKEGIREKERERKGKERKGKREEKLEGGRRRNKIHGLFFRPMAFGGYGGVSVKSPQALTTCGDSCPILQIGLGLLHFFLVRLALLPTSDGKCLDVCLNDGIPFTSENSSDGVFEFSVLDANGFLCGSQQDDVCRPGHAVVLCHLFDVK